MVTAKLKVQILQIHLLYCYIESEAHVLSRVKCIVSYNVNLNVLIQMLEIFLKTYYHGKTQNIINHINDKGFFSWRFS